MRELVDYLVSQIITRDSYDIIEAEDGTIVEIRVIVDSDKMGRIIGRSGRLAKAIRTIVRAAAQDSDKSYDVVITER
ncbi:MAG TPA: KH domain-containing protein [Clostridia bacterium]|jgi:hypothetical protein|nr:KH domain-containing protein [Clostridia bacterium]